MIKRMAALIAAAMVAVAAVAGDFVEVTGSNVRLRQSPSLQGKIYSDAKGQPVYPAKGAMLDLTGESGDFFQVNYKGQTLYISKQFSRRVRGNAAGQPSSKPQAAPAQAAPRPGKAGRQADAPSTTPTVAPKAVIVTGTNVRLRSGASLKSPALQDAKGNNLHPAKGQKLECTGMKGDFYKVTFNGLTAYISKQYATPAQ